MAPTLRQALADSAPRTIALKKAWPTLLRQLRAARRRGAQGVVHKGRGDLERSLGRPLRPDVDAARVEVCKADLARLCRATLPEVEADALALRVDQGLVGLVAKTADQPVGVAVVGWPACLTPAQRLLLLGPAGQDLGAVNPIAAAGLRDRLHGQVLAGSVLSVQVDLPADTVLPAVPRGARDRGIRDRAPPWLSALDAEGRVSLSPRGIAQAQAALLGGPTVIDACVGCGGNAIAFAQAGHRVIGIELDRGRAAMARTNAQALGADIEVRVGDCLDLLPDLLAAHPGAVLFVDPPWGGADWDRGETRWPAFDAFKGGLDGVLSRHPRVGLKLPRSLDPATLPRRAAGWRVCMHLQADGRHGHHIAKCLTAVGGS